jgi:hypothetical protein
MQQKDVVIGGRYTAKVSGRIQVVRITEIHNSYSRATGYGRTTYAAINEATGRRVMIRSAQRLRRKVED